MSLIAKYLLVATSMSPALFVFAVSWFERHCTWYIPTVCIVFGLGLVFICRWVLSRLSKEGQRYPLNISSLERTDREVLAFMVVYLLPFLQSTTPAFASGWITTSLVVIIISVCIVHAEAFHFNPVMFLFFRYRFYSVKDRHGVSSSLISKRRINQLDQNIPTVILTSDIYLDTGDDDD